MEITPNGTNLTMALLDLPVELVDHILYFSILSRSVARAFRLKFVCSMLDILTLADISRLKLPAAPFYASFNRVLFHTGLLDIWASDGSSHPCVIEQYHSGDTLRHEYMLFNCRNLPDPSLWRFAEIRDVAGVLLRHFETQEEGTHRDLSFDAILDRLCTLGLNGGGKASNTGRFDSGGRRLVFPPLDPGSSLLPAATYFGCESLVRDLLGQGQDPVSRNYLFPSPIYIAARTGQAKLLELMQESLPNFEDPNPTIKWTDFRSKIGPGSLEGAAIRGDVDMARLALYPPSRTIQPSDANVPGDGAGAGSGSDDTTTNSALVLGVEPGSVAQDSKLGRYITRSMFLARSPDVYQYLRSFFGRELHSQLNDNILAPRAAAGDIVMVRHLLEMGADPSPKDTDIRGPPLMRAVGGWHEDVVDILLEHGADPNELGGFRHGTVLTWAASAGSMRLLRKLLDAGVDIGTKDGFTLRSAIRREHTAMVKMLLGRVKHREANRRAKLKDARDKGLESMVELLEPWALSGEAPES